MSRPCVVALWNTALERDRIYIRFVLKEVGNAVHRSASGEPPVAAQWTSAGPLHLR